MKDRLDKVLADRKLVSTRSQAKSLIENGDVLVNDKVCKKAGELVDENAHIKITSPLYVGRGALKLESALSAFGFQCGGKVFLDVGASTGGFTEVLLQQGAVKVYCIDVGHGQLAPKILNDHRVINLEGTNIKELLELPELGDAAVMDLSFISITKVLINVRNLLKPLGDLIVLIKPQFEVGVERLPKDGVVKDKSLQELVLNEVISYAQTAGWKHLKTMDSPILGKSGNKEFLCWFQKI